MYWVTSDGEVGFVGYRRSFIDGCPLIKLSLIDCGPNGFLLNGSIYAPAGPEFIGPGLVAYFELYGAKLETSSPDTIHELLNQ
jgi:hypothetical protein